MVNGNVRVFKASGLPTAPQQVLSFEGNSTHSDHFRLLLPDGNGNLLVGGRWVLAITFLLLEGIWFTVRNCW